MSTQTSLDFSMYENGTLDITFDDGTVVNVKQPNVRLLMELTELNTSASKQKDEKKAIEMLVNITRLALNNNKNNIVFTNEQIENLFTAKMLIDFYPVYQKFAGLDNPN